MKIFINIFKIWLFNLRSVPPLRSALTPFHPSAICLLSIPSQGGHAKMALVCSSLLSPMGCADAISSMGCCRYRKAALSLYAYSACPRRAVPRRWLLLILRYISDGLCCRSLQLRSVPPLRSLTPLYAYSASPRRADTRRWSFASSSLYLR